MSMMGVAIVDRQQTSANVIIIIPSVLYRLIYQHTYVRTCILEAAYYSSSHNFSFLSMTVYSEIACLWNKFSCCKVE